MAPGGDNVFTPFGETGCPKAENPDRMQIVNVAKINVAKIDVAKTSLRI